MGNTLEPRAVMSTGDQEQALRQFLNVVQEQGHAQGNFLGLLHVLIGRRIATVDGDAVANGLSWRQLADLLRTLRWDPEAVRDLGIDPTSLPPRDRRRFWYLAINQATVDSAEAVEAGDALAEEVQKSGYVVGPSPF